MIKMLVVATLFVTQIASASTEPHVTSAPLGPSTFQVSETTEIPDGTLSPGKYTIRVADHLTDRMVVEIQGANGTRKELFLGVPAETSAATGPVLFTGSKATKALRGFSFTGRTTINFVYPKNDAVALAKANGVAVVAVDPASEGMPASPELSADDRRMITLWMLTPTPVGPGDASAGIQAARYQAPPTPAVSDAPVQAEAPTPAPVVPPPAERAPVQAEAPVPAPAVAPAPKHAAVLSAEAKPPVIRRLPKTASMMPLVGISGASFLCLAVGLGFFRRNANGV